MFEIVEALDFPLDPRQDRHVLPPGIETMPPGPDLASALAGVDRSTLNGFELMVTLQARARQIAYEQAEYFADIVELTYSDFGGEGSQPDRSSDPDEGIADELRAGLTLTRTAANYQLDIAFGLNGLPAVGEALRRGSIDLAKARVFINETGHLLPHEAESVAGAGLEHASEMTTGQLGARLRRLGMEADPEAASGRYREGLDDRRVEKRSNPDGTAELWARQLPVDRLAAIWDRLDRVAHTMRGDGRLLDQIRADILMDLLEGNHVEGVTGGGAVEVRVDLTTLLDLDERAGEIPGWGPVVSDIARQIVQRQADGKWEFVVTDPDTGALIASGVTRRRPTAAQRRHVQAIHPTCIFMGCRTRMNRRAMHGTMPSALHASRGGLLLAPHQLQPRLLPQLRHL